MAKRINYIGIFFVLLVLCGCTGTKENDKANNMESDINAVSEFSEIQTWEKKELPYREYWTNEYNNIITHRYEGVVDLEFLSGNEDIISLNLVGGEFFDLRPLAAVKNLKYLDLYKVSTLEDISPLGILNLQRLDIVSCENIRSYEPVAYLTGLKRLRIASYTRNSLLDAAHLSALSNLEELEAGLYTNMFVNVHELGKLVHLKKLTITDTDIIDLACIVEDIMPLAESKTIKDMAYPMYAFNMSDEVWELFKNHGIRIYDPHDR
jgi:hypothetical protein